MNRILNEIKTGWNEVRWAWHFSAYLLPTTALAVLLAYAIDGEFSSPPTLMQILLVTLAGLLSLYFASPDSSVVLRLKKRHAAQRLGGKVESTANSTTGLPVISERLLLLLFKEDESNIIGDLAEEYAQFSGKHGELYAKIWLYKQVFASVEPLILKSIIKWVGLLGIAELLHRIIGR